MVQRTFDYYFAYGSNLCLERMKRRCPGSHPVERFDLDGWRLVFKVYADVIPAEGHVVAGALYTITAADELALDRCEGYKRDLPDESSYIKFYLDATINGKAATVMFYYMHLPRTGPPTDKYFGVVRQGYDDWEIDTASLYEALQDSLG